MSSLFTQLLDMTSQQDEPQRLLFLFAKTDSGKKQKNYMSGHVEPVMCVDKLPHDLSSFDALVKEADGISKEWDFMFIAGLSGSEGKAPSEDDAEPYLNKMSNDIADGQDLGRYVVLDRKEQPIEIAAK